MTKGARTVEEVREITGACGECEGCKENLGWILSSVCGCAKASLETVVNAVKNGANTVEKIGEITGAGTKFGNCKGLIQNVIDGSVKYFVYRLILIKIVDTFFMLI